MCAVAVCFMASTCLSQECHFWVAWCEIWNSPRLACYDNVRVLCTRIRNLYRHFISCTTLLFIGIAFLALGGNRLAAFFLTTASTISPFIWTILIALFRQVLESQEAFVSSILSWSFSLLVESSNYLFARKYGCKYIYFFLSKSYLCLFFRWLISSFANFFLLKFSL